MLRATVQVPASEAWELLASGKWKADLAAAAASTDDDSDDSEVEHPDSTQGQKAAREESSAPDLAADLAEREAAVRLLVKSRGLGSSHSILVMNGRPLDLDGLRDVESVAGVLQQGMDRELRLLLREIYTGRLKDRSPHPSNPRRTIKTDVLGYILDNSLALPRLNNRIYGDDRLGLSLSNPIFISNEGTIAVHPAAAAAASRAPPPPKSAVASQTAPPEPVGIFSMSLSPSSLDPELGRCIDRLHYLTAPGTEEQIKEVTLWIVSSLGAAEGRRLALESLGYLSSNGEHQEGIRLAIIDASGADGARQSSARVSLLARALHAAAGLPTRRSKIPAFLTALLSDEQLAAQLATSVDDADLRNRVIEAASAAGLNTHDLETQMAAATATLADEACDAALATYVGIGLPTRQNGSSVGCAVVANGRVVMGCDGPDGDMGPITGDDLNLIADFALRRQLSGHVADLVQTSLDRELQVRLLSEAGKAALW